MRAAMASTLNGVSEAISTLGGMSDLIKWPKANISPESVVKDSKGQQVEKLCGQSEWQPRFLQVTADKFIILNDETSNEIVDYIPLVD